MKILLVGSPNVGKSSLFSRLTGVRVICSNYPGTTVTYCSGKIMYAGEQAELIDAPGVYSLNPQSPAEIATVDMIQVADIIINVIDATNLERNLYLTLQTLEQGKPTVVALNMVDDARHLGVEIDADELERMLGAPIVKTVAVTGEGIKELSDMLPHARATQIKRTDEERWKEVGHITSRVQTLKHHHHTILETLEDATIQPLTGIPLAIITLYLTFTLIVTLGNWGIAAALDPFFNNIWGPLMHTIVELIFPSGIMNTILLGQPGDMVAGLGLLTTGFYVPLDMILPFVILFYFALSLLEDIGYLPRLATLMDNVMHKIGLHGSAVIPTILGLGCKVPGLLAVRILENRKQRFIAAALIILCVPCLAQNAVIFGLLSRQGIRYVAIAYGTLLTLYIIIGLILNRLLPGESPEILLEIPPYRRPDSKTLIKKTWIRVRFFLTEAVPYIILGVLAVNLMHVFGLMNTISSVFGPLMSSLFGLPPEAASALILGFLRKDFTAGLLAPIPMTPMQLTIASTLVVVYMPCMATLTVLYKELGLKDFLKAMALMLVVTVIVGVCMKAILL